MLWNVESCSDCRCACLACHTSSPPRHPHPASGLATHIILPCYRAACTLQEHAITSDHALSLPMMPKRIVIVGAGYIAVEFSGIFNGMGADVSAWDWSGLKQIIWGPQQLP